MIHFTEKQVNEIIEAIKNVHWLFIARNINPNVVPSDVMKKLIRMGFKRSQVLKYPELAFHFGLLSMYLADKTVKNITFEKLKKIIKEGKILPLNEAEKTAIKIVEQRAVDGITGLGNKISSNLRTLLIEADLKQRKWFEELIKDKAKKAVQKRESIKYIVSELGKQTNDWTRDLDRIADFILHEAYDNGRAFAAKKKYGNDVLVYKRVHKDACEHCKRLYIKDRKTGEPKIFKLSELMDNGTNIKVPQKDWKPVVGAVHPWCRCDLEIIPEGYIWDSKTKNFVMKTDDIKSLKNQVKAKVRIEKK